MEKTKSNYFKVSNNAVNITTPIPSLNKLSTNNGLFNFLGTFTVAKIPKTAIGSVGDINAQKIK